MYTVEGDLITILRVDRRREIGGHPVMGPIVEVLPALEFVADEA